MRLPIVAILIGLATVLVACSSEPSGRSVKEPDEFAMTGCQQFVDILGPDSDDVLDQPEALNGYRISHAILKLSEVDGIADKAESLVKQMEKGPEMRPNNQWTNDLLADCTQVMAIWKSNEVWGIDQ